MRMTLIRAAVAAVIGLCLTGVIEARDPAAPLTGADADALRELLEGSSGRQEVWGTVPELVILTSVMEFSGPDMMAGYVATGETLTTDEVTGLERDLTGALSVLTGGRVPSFAAIHVESVAAGQLSRMFRRGQLVVGQFRGVQDRAGTVGFGGRTALGSVITAGAVVLDRDFDRQSDQRLLLRTHELGHAIGFNHVESRQSVMNVRVGPEVTDFDRSAIDLAFNGPLAFQGAQRIASPQPHN